jgi:hypothetical protein
VQNDLRNMVTALECYAVDRNMYPSSIARSPLEPEPRRNIDGMDKRLLTSPIAYMTTIPGDIFVPAVPSAVVEAGALNLYGSHRGPGLTVYNRPFNSYMMWSIGPDRESQTGGYRTLPVIEQAEAFGLLTFGPTYPGTRYDPTNGTITIGDIYRFGPNTNDLF